MKTKILTINSQFPELDRIAQCAKVIRNGGLVIFPTETVYGIAANYLHKKAMKRLREIKKRAKDKPFSILVSRKDKVDQLAENLPCQVYKLIDEFWPGPLTIVIPSKEEDKTVGIRMPNNYIALRLMEQSQCPIAAPSANIGGHEAPVTCQEAVCNFQDKVEIAIDGGPTTIGQSSTVVDLTTDPFSILRKGPISDDAIQHVIGRKDILFVCTGNSCRSVMAEYLMKKMLGARKDVKVVSSGTGVYVSLGASYDTIEVLKAEGIDASMHRSQPLTKTLLKKSDLILVMSQTHRRQILDICPGVEEHIYLLREFAQLPQGSGTNFDIPDPIGKSREIYEECLWMIKEAIEKIVKLI